MEFAFASVILLTLVFGVINLSQMFYAYQYIANAAREGTRFAIVRGSSCQIGVQTFCPAAATDVQSFLQNNAFWGINPKYMTVTTTWPDSGVTCTPSADPCNNPGNRVQVQVTYQFPLRIPFIPNETLSMQSTSEMVISQ